MVQWRGGGEGGQQYSRVQPPFLFFNCHVIHFTWRCVFFAFNIPPLHDSKKNCIIGQLERLGLPKIDFIWSQYVLLVNLMVP